jgi:hypothetical protein
MENRLKQFLLHRGYPKKRYLLKDKRCGFCEKEFDTIDSLKSHLSKNCCFTPYFHHSHIKLYQKMGLSNEMILSNQMTKCPSLLCNEIFSTPHHLIQHLDRIIHAKEVDDSSEKQYLLDYKFFPSEKCMVCLESTPDVIYVNCGHVNVCKECYTQLDDEYINQCPHCRTISTYIIISPTDSS